MKPVVHEVLLQRCVSTLFHKSAPYFTGCHLLYTLLWSTIYQNIYSQTSVLFLNNGGILVDYRAFKPYTLVGPPVR